MAAKAPGAILSTVSGTFWVHETPSEIEAKREEVTAMGESIRLAGLESTDEEGKLDAYTLDINPVYIVSVRGISQRSFERVTGMVREREQAPPPPPIPPGIMYLDLSGKGDIQEAAKIADTDPETTCCCGHRADHHMVNGEEILSCTETDCGCPIFHTHDGDDDAKES